MGLFPCSLCSARFRGKAKHAYPALLNGVGALRSHQRLCRDCFNSVTDYLTANGVTLASEEQALPAKLNCVECGKKADPRDPLLMVTLYPDDDRVDVACAVHAGKCAESLVSKWSLVA